MAIVVVATISSWQRSCQAASLSLSSRTSSSPAPYDYNTSTNQSAPATSQTNVISGANTNRPNLSSEQLQAQLMMANPVVADNQQLRPSIHWGRCPQLQPTLQEKVKKAQVITKCLENTPVPDNITRETIEMHRELVAACALREEGWFEIHPNASSLSEPLTAAMKAAVAEVTAATAAIENTSTVSGQNSTGIATATTTHADSGSSSAEEELDEELFGYSAIFSGGASYNYEKAEREIRSKRLQPEIEQKVLQFHANCRAEAQHKYANPVQIIAQIQLYQACMDYFISDVCQIQVQV